jgi:cobalt-zinc-cadmium resistance protein CzcA
LNGTPARSRLRSISLFGLSFVTLTFADGVDAYFARQQIIERMRGRRPARGRAAGARPARDADRRGLPLHARGAGADPMTLRTLQDWTVRPALLRVPGVADVVSLRRAGQGDPRRADRRADGGARRLQLDDLERALRRPRPTRRAAVRSSAASRAVRDPQLGTFKSLDDIERGPRRLPRRVPVFVKDVATVRQGYAPRQGVVTRDADYDAVEGIVLMRGENPSVVLGRCETRVDELEARAARRRPGSPFYDRTELVDTTLRHVFHNLLEGALLVCLVLFVFLLSMRAALIVGAVIPLSLRRRSSTCTRAA